MSSPIFHVVRNVFRPPVSLQFNQSHESVDQRPSVAAASLCTASVVEADVQNALLESLLNKRRGSTPGPGETPCWKWLYELWDVGEMRSCPSLR